ncbi:uncharacterized protein [Eucyclogobius newberryi]|uniref:uncharacterized protein n=1 Tax=Eucyclogobius newberryi TaxID=166745 RepID=UPI003B59462E
MEGHPPDVLPPQVFVPPELTDGESFHVFVIYSSADLLWTHALIQELEDRGLRVCFHERDFIPGRPILENMSDCIQQSQKVLLVLSQDFVKSQWCLLEVNMSLFRDSLQRTHIVPVLLQKDLSIPLYLSHLTYLEVSRPDFREQLLQVLCLPNHQLQNSPMVKVIIPADEDVHSDSDCGVWSIEIPQQLHLIIQEPDHYKKAIRFINRVSQEKVTPFIITNKVYLNLHLNFCFQTFIKLLFLSLLLCAS